MRAGQFQRDRRLTEKQADVSVVSLSGMAGGDLANVNRWRDQVKLGPIDEATLAKSAEHVRRTATIFSSSIW